MINANAVRFIEEVMKGLWPAWEPAEEELRLWVWLLSKYDYEKARMVIDRWFTEQEKIYNRPAYAKIRVLLLNKLPIPKAENEQYLHFTLKRQIEDGLFEDPRKYFGEGLPCIEALSNRALDLAEQHRKLYGGQWVVFWPPQNK